MATGAIIGSVLLASTLATFALSGGSQVSMYTAPTTIQTSSQFAQRVAPHQSLQASSFTRPSARAMPQMYASAETKSIRAAYTEVPAVSGISTVNGATWLLAAIAAVVSGTWLAALKRPAPAQPHLEWQMMSVSPVDEDKDTKPDNKEPKDDEKDFMSMLQNTPFRLGYEARAWTRKLVEGVSSPNTAKTRRIQLDDFGEDDLPGLGTSVLVVGAFTPVGQVLTRKLLLRGYTVRLLLSEAGASSESALDLPDTDRVETVVGALESHSELMKAVSGMSKVVYCASLPGEDVDLQVRLAVDAAGPRAVCRAMQDIRLSQKQSEPHVALATPAKITVAKFKNLSRWSDVKVTQKQASILPVKWASLVFEGQATFKPGETKTGAKVGRFSGEFQANRDATADVSMDLSPDELQSILKSEVLLMKAHGDENRYSMRLEIEDEAQGLKTYTARFAAPKRWNSLRIPTDTFQNDDGEGLPTSAPGVGGKLVLGYRCPRKGAVGNTGRAKFCLDIQFIKAIPASKETDFVLVSQSSASKGLRGGADLMAIQSRGEDAVRNSGISYTIIRPGPMLDIPSEGKPLMFDQSRRSGSSISCTDVADVCVKVLKDKGACNKAFDVFNEVGEADDSFYDATSTPAGDEKRVSEVLSVLDKHI